MRVIEHIEKAKGPQFSFEIIPPARGRSVRDLIDTVESLSPYHPSWIDVTSHSAHAHFNENKDGTVTRRTYKKRPGTLGICGVIQNRFRIDVVAHVLCLGFSREETEDALIELNYLGVENVLALRGDGPNFDKQFGKDKSQNYYAIDLVRQVQELRAGRYLGEVSNSEPMNFCVGVAGYPEKHFEAANLKTDIQWLKNKVDAGAEYIVSQMFFDNERFFSWVDACRSMGITVPIIPGIKLLRSASQLRSIPKAFHVDLPNDLVDEILESPKHVPEIGLRFAKKQAAELINRGHNNLHFYVMQDAGAVGQVIESLL